jgi:KEOPS complex subunit Cgi121
MKILEGVVKVDSLRDFLQKINGLGCTITFLDANYIVDRSHVEFAVEKAIKAWNAGRRVARTLSMEILLYSAARRQISDAVEMGLKEGVNEVVVVVLEDECFEKLKELGFEEKQVLRLDNSKINRIKRFFEIGDNELEIVGIEKLPLLVRERIALFDITKSG